MQGRNLLLFYVGVCIAVGLASVLVACSKPVVGWIVALLLGHCARPFTLKSVSGVPDKWLTLRSNPKLHSYLHVCCKGEQNGIWENQRITSQIFPHKFTWWFSTLYFFFGLLKIEMTPPVLNGLVEASPSLPSRWTCTSWRRFPWGQRHPTCWLGSLTSWRGRWWRLCACPPPCCLPGWPRCPYPLGNYSSYLWFPHQPHPPTVWRIIYTT